MDTNNEQWRLIISYIKKKNQENRMKRFDNRNVTLYEELRNGVYDNHMFQLQNKHRQGN